MENKITLLKNNTSIEIEYDKTMVFIGANGSGKSRLGAWIEHQNPKQVHRISAQRNLSFNSEIALKSFEKSQMLFYFGSEFNGYQPNYAENNTYDAKSGSRWQMGKLTTGFLDDYNFLLSVLYAQQNLRNEELAKKIDINIGKAISFDFKVTSNIEKLIELWNKILPHRQIDFIDQKVIVKKDTESYFGTELSDGERVIIYLIGQVLSVEQNFILIVDEPEIHIHKSIINTLWDELEKLRNDISIIYITHDLDFAKERFGSKKIWVKSYDGKENWDFQEIDFEDNAEFNQIHFEIMGSRKPVLFIEGEKGSLDYKLYSKIYPNYTIIPVKSCSTVIEMVNSYKKEWTLHNVMPIGIVDRDFRDDNEIFTLKEKGVFVLDVLEVENLFCLPDVAGFIYDVISSSIHLSKSKQQILEEINTSIVEIFNSEKDKFILNATHKKISSLMSKFPKPKHTEKINDKYIEFLDTINITTIQSSIKAYYETILSNNDINKMVCSIDNKGFSARVSKILEMTKDQYQATVLKHLDNKSLRDVICKYIIDEEMNA